MKQVSARHALILALLAPFAMPLAMAGDADAPTVLDLGDLKKNTANYAWFDFRPNLKKLILAGAPESEHISILWYASANGSVGLHYHAKTESVLAIDGSQSDAKGSYPSGTLYFNPPGSGHAISDSSGFFLLAYASPPDFKQTSLIGPYTPVRLDTASLEFEKSLTFKKDASGAGVHEVALDPQGGMRSAFIQGGAAEFAYAANYLVVIKGSCMIDGAARAKGMLVVGKSTTPRSYRIAAPKDGACLALAVAFTAPPPK